MLAATASTALAQPESVSLQELTARAVAQAAAEAGVAASSIDVLSAQDVTWRDGSLGCPDPARLYTQALVPGYRIRLAHAGRTWDFHASRHGRLVVCPQGRSEAPLPDSRS